MEAVDADAGLTELERIERWRRRCLIEAGYDRQTAARIAIAVDVDLHEAVRLLRDGCCVRLAAEILL